MPTHGNCICSEFAPGQLAGSPLTAFTDEAQTCLVARSNRGEDTKRKFTHSKRQRLIRRTGPQRPELIWTERRRRRPVVYVTDFLNMGVGPIRTGIFNLADVAMMAGMVLLV